MGDFVNFQRRDFTIGTGSRDVAGDCSTATAQLQDMFSIQRQEAMVYPGFGTASPISSEAIRMDLSEDLVTYP